MSSYNTASRDAPGVQESAGRTPVDDTELDDEGEATRERDSNEDR